VIGLPLRLEDMETILEWRSTIPETLRTPYPITNLMQKRWFEEVISSRNSNIRYTGFWREDLFPRDPVGFLGMGGIESVQFENGNAEISLLINPAYRGKGYGKQAVDLILDTAFNRYRLETVWGECFLCSPAVGFWKKIVEEKKAFSVELPGRKYFNGKLYGSYYFSFSKCDPL